MFSSFLQLFGVNFVFILVMASVILALALWRRPAYAVLKRNFLAYFTSPIGYVFLCAFVCMTAFAAFWSEDFFNANLANLDQLNRYLPLILLVFIPAITMSIWSEERRQGTDELLLTIPATDFDIVLGKYLAAVAIYTVSLLFSQFCNFIVLSTLGSPDIGLLLSNYLGYWLAGLAMLAIGMVASFLTHNLTVGFVLGVLLNAPLVMTGYADVVLGSGAARIVSRWSIEQQFADFQAGVVSLGSVLFFLLVAAVMFYISLVLIGRRHWSGGRDGHSMGGHYLLRGLSLIVAVGAACVLLAKWDPVRADLTSEKLNSLHPKTVSLLKDIKTPHPVIVDAYVSTDLPEAFVERRVDLSNTLRQLKHLAGTEIETNLHEVDLFSPDAAKAKTEYGIEPRDVQTQVRGAQTRKSIIFGVGVRCGLERVVIPFMGQGANIEHELVRAVVTVADASVPKETPKTDSASKDQKATDQKANDEKAKDEKSKDEKAKDEKAKDEQAKGEKVESEKSKDEKAKDEKAKSDATKSKGRKRLGVVMTEARLFGSGGSPLGEERGSDQPFIQELKRQYKVERIDPNETITDEIDVLLCVQPSSLSPKGMANFIAAVKSGKPTAIFEDPMPVLFDVPATSAPPRPPMGMPFGMASPQPKAKIEELWKLLGLQFRTAKDPDVEPEEDAQLPATEKYGVGWQDFNPHEADTDRVGISHQFVFVTPTSGAAEPFSKDSPIVAGMQEVLLLFPGALEPMGGVNQKHTPLMRTNSRSGLIRWSKLFSMLPPELLLQLEKTSEQASEGFVLAYHVERPATGEPITPPTGDEAPQKDGGLNVVVVADVDVLGGLFFEFRNIGEDARNPIANWNLDNVPLVLNMIDFLSGDNRFMEIRRRRPRHRELTTITRLKEQAKENRKTERDALDKEFDKELKDAETRLREKRKERAARPGMDRKTWNTEERLAKQDEQQRLVKAKAEQEQIRDKRFREIDRELSAQVQQVQDRYKILAVVLPPLLPLVIAGCVYFVRRSREGEGVSRDRIV